ncbi:MAG: type II secretion system F family protein, partial [Thermodesulfobacteriota bacterium]
RAVEALAFRTSVLGTVLKKLRLAQVFRSLAIMTSGGVPLTTALAVAAQGLGRSNYAAALERAAEMVGQGRSLTEGFEASGLFPPVARRMVAVGETSGALDAMLDRVAQNYEEETDRALSVLTSLVEPAIILVMGLVVGFVVISVLLPVFDLSRLVH